MTADLFVEAVDTAVRLGWALAAWIALTALAATLALYAVTVIVWTVVRGVWRTVRAAWARRRRQAAPGASERPSRLPDSPDTPERAADRRETRRVPSWAQTQPINHEWDEAA